MNERTDNTLQCLSRRTGLPKATLFRLLATLRAEGYVAEQHGRGTYRLTDRVRELSSGYGERLALVQQGAPVALRVTRTIKWPLAIGVLEEFSVVVRYSTMPYSPLAVHTTTVGHRHGLLESAMGTAYIAFCSNTERDILLRALARLAPEGRLANEASVRAALARVRERGYGLRLPRRKGDSATIAVPIPNGEDIAGVLSLTTFGSLMTQDLIAQHRPVLQETAQEIASRLAKVEAPD